MARYYGYRRGRYYRRGYRRGYRRYGGSSLRRYRAVSLNDNETKVLSFSTVCDLTLPLTNGAATQILAPTILLGGNISSATVAPSSGRAYFAGMLFDRYRMRSLSVTIRPKVMPSTSATNYLFYAAWDRYGKTTSAVAPIYSIRTDPSAKQVVWTPGGLGTPLRTWITSTARDRNQYIGIYHAPDLTYWRPNSDDGSVTEIFYPMLLLAVEAVTTESTVVQFTVHARVTVEFQGGFSSTTLNYTPSSASAASAASEAPTVPLEERIAALESKYNSNPADNNDDFVSVLRDLSNPQ